MERTFPLRGFSLLEVESWAKDSQPNTSDEDGNGNGYTAKNAILFFCPAYSFQTFDLHFSVFFRVCSAVAVAAVVNGA
jgi:hypothetical protein